MLNLGAFEKEEKTGRIIGIFYGVNMTPTQIVFNPAKSEKGAAYYKVYAQSKRATVEAGAAWPKVTKNDKARNYLDVRLNSPALPAPFYGKLMESEIVPNQYNLLWDESYAAPKAANNPAQRQAPALTP